MNYVYIVVKKEGDAESRCVGVVTKCDLVPEEEGKSDILQRLRMKRESDVHLHLGSIAVRNRARDEMKMTHEEAQKKEDELFEKHPVLQVLKRNERGYGTLTQKIVELRSTMVNRWIPKVKKVLRTKISEHNESLKALGNPTWSAACRRILSRLITKVDKKIDATS
jgi:hypothetical protein